MKIQIIIVILLISIIPMLIISKVLIESYRQEAITQRVNELQSHGNTISNLLLSTGLQVTTEAVEQFDISREINQIADVFLGRVMIVNRNLQVIEDTYELEVGKTVISEVVIKGIKGSDNKFIDEKNQYVELTIPIMDVAKKEAVGVILISFSMKNIFHLYESLNQKAIILYITLSIFILCLAFIYAKLISGSLRKVVNSINHITDGYMNETVSINGFTEVEQISESFNRMMNKLQKLEASRQEFVSNVSHELKTPITSIKVLSDSLLMQEDVPVELYREFLNDITEEIERENKIINDLLSLVKLDKTASEMNIAAISINELLEQILKRLRPIAAKRNIELVFESFRPVVAEVDEVKLSLAINNLIENAIKYNYDDGWVRVSLNADHKFFYIKVLDSGVGIPEDAQDNIFERFYRVDKARSRETGGTGLGLSITRNAVLMHRGAIKVYSKEHEGTTFTVRIPLNYIA